jgi:hypothetical protein
MPDAGYSTQNLILRSLGIVARTTDDQPPAGQGYYANLSSLEEIYENSLATRLGTRIINRTGSTIDVLPGAVHSLGYLGGLSGSAYRYAGVGASLYRRSGTAQGAYTNIFTTLSGNPWQSASFQTNISSFPYIYIADSAQMIKDNGLLATPQQLGIFQPQYPVIAQAQDPDEIILDSFVSSSYTTSGIGSFSPNSVVFGVNSTSAITSTGIQSISLGATPNPSALFQSWIVDAGGANQETVLVISVTPTGFIANFTKNHTTGALLHLMGLTGTVAANTDATISRSFGGTPISAWPTTLEQEDYIGLQLYVGDPNAISSITLKFDCGDGSFTGDFFWRTIGQGPLQTALNTTTDSSTAAADSLLSDTLGIYSSEPGGVSGLNTGQNQYNTFLLQLSDFSSTGRADFNDPVYNWNNVNGYQIEIVTNDADSSILIEANSLLLFGGAGPDSFAGVSYGYAFTFYNPADGTESNPSMFPTDVNPPQLTNRVLPRRQPVELTLTHPTLDPQATYARVYRVGGTLNDNYRRIDQIPISGGSTTYVDLLSDLDIQQADTLSLTNDVPVTSTLPTPVANAVGVAITTTNQVVTVLLTTPIPVIDQFPGLSVAQQVDIGSVTAANFEIVIILSLVTRMVGPLTVITGFTAFVQNTHEVGETISATATYGQPVTLIAEAFEQMYYAGDPNNPSYLYYSAKGQPQAVGSASFVVVSTPDDPITAIVSTGANLYVSTLTRWWSIAPGSNQNSTPTVYPTNATHGCVAPNGWTLRDGVVYYQALDGFRAFSGGQSTYISGIVEFIEQGIGTTPIQEANQAMFAQTRCSWWNKFVFFSYIGQDALRHRLILDVDNKRWRNDDLDAQSMLLEDTTNTLLFGDSTGLVRQDRVNLAYDEGNEAGSLIQTPIAFDLQTPYSDGGAPEIAKNYNEFTGDFNTNGVPVTVELLFNDGEFTETIGTITTTERERVNLNLNNGLGYQGYKVSCQLTGSGIERVFLYQAKLRSIGLAQTRQSFDSYWLRMGIDESKLLKQIYAEVTAGAAISCEVFYDGSATPGFAFTVPFNGGIRFSYRQRLPAVKFRLVRFVFTSTVDFLLWETSKYEWKPCAQGKGWSVEPLMP